ncbi:MAG: MaoC family dehydratase [Solirubrobacteraceae bacterium]|jgi:acyl dehydratase
MLTVTTIQELRTRAGQELGASEFHEVTQDHIDAFAEATGDRQWIHTDPVRARDTPMGATIAHGYYTLALAPALLAEVLPLDGFAMGVNYGLDKLRFPAPLPVGSAVRMRVWLDAVDEIPGGATLTLTLTFKRERSDKPVCVAQALYRVYEGA